MSISYFNKNISYLQILVMFLWLLETHGRICTLKVLIVLEKELRRGIKYSTIRIQ